MLLEGLWVLEDAMVRRNDDDGVLHSIQRIMSGLQAFLIGKERGACLVVPLSQDLHVARGVWNVVVSNNLNDTLYCLHNARCCD